MSTAVKSDPALWARIVKKIKAGSVAGTAGTWNARKAQLAVSEYKEAGGSYHGRKSRDNSLAQWTKEDWGYIDGKPGNRYLPKQIRNKLTTADARTENRRKKDATRKGKTRASYSARTRDLFRQSRKSRKSHKSKKSRKSRK
jgi:hypothetical protein